MVARDGCCVARKRVLMAILAGDVTFHGHLFDAVLPTVSGFTRTARRAERRAQSEAGWLPVLFTPYRSR
jgi:hypothetical protein